MPITTLSSREVNQDLGRANEVGYLMGLDDLPENTLVSRQDHAAAGDQRPLEDAQETFLVKVGAEHSTAQQTSLNFSEDIWRVIGQIRDGQRATGAEIVLDVDDDHGGAARRHLLGEAETNAWRRLAVRVACAGGQAITSSRMG